MDTVRKPHDPVLQDIVRAGQPIVPRPWCLAVSPVVRYSMAHGAKWHRWVSLPVVCHRMMLGSLVGRCAWTPPHVGCNSSLYCPVKHSPLYPVQLNTVYWYNLYSPVEILRCWVRTEVPRHYPHLCSCATGGLHLHRSLRGGPYRCSPSCGWLSGCSRSRSSHVEPRALNGPLTAYDGLGLSAYPTISVYDYPGPDPPSLVTFAGLWLLWLAGLLRHWRSSTAERPGSLHAHGSCACRLPRSSRCKQ